MTTPVPAAAHHAGPGLIALRTTVGWLLGVVVAVALGIATMFLGLTLSSYDERHRHIPGHLLYNALIVGPGLAQFVYLLPLHRWVRRRQHRGVAWGLCVGAGLVILANGALLWLNFVWSQMD